MDEDLEKLIAEARAAADSYELLEAEVIQLRKHLQDIKESAEKKFIAAVEALLVINYLVQQQAEDEALWSVPAEGTQPIGEAYLQSELRKLHVVIEYMSGPILAKEPSSPEQDLGS